MCNDYVEKLYVMIMWRNYILELCGGIMCNDYVGNHVRNYVEKLYAMIMWRNYVQGLYQNNLQWFSAGTIYNQVR